MVGRLCKAAPSAMPRLRRMRQKQRASIQHMSRTGTFRLQPSRRQARPYKLALEHFFEAFHTAKPDGLGRGLTICRSIVASFGGTIDVKADLARGALSAFRWRIHRYVPTRSLDAALRDPMQRMGEVRSQSLVIPELTFKMAQKKVGSSDCQFDRDAAER